MTTCATLARGLHKVYLRKILDIGDNTNKMFDFESNLSNRPDAS